VAAGEVLNAMNVPERHWGARLACLKGLEHAPVIEGYVDEVGEHVKAGRGFVLSGEYSRGKSAIGSICLKAAYAKSGVIGYWVKSRSLPELRINRVMFSDVESVWERCCSIPLLVIDELLLVSDSRYTEQAIEELVRVRVDECLATIVTTNHRPVWVRDNFPSIYAALQESAAFRWVKVEGYDFRTDPDGRLKL